MVGPVSLFVIISSTDGASPWVKEHYKTIRAVVQIASVIPGISLFTGVSRIYCGIHASQIENFENMMPGGSQDEKKQHKTFFIGKQIILGVVEILGLGAIFSLVDEGGALISKISRSSTLGIN